MVTTRRTRRAKVKYVEPEDSSDEYQPAESSTESEDESDDEPVRIRKNASSETLERMYLDSTPAAKTDSKLTRSISPYSVQDYTARKQAFRERIMQRAETLTAVPLKRKRVTISGRHKQDYAGYTSNTGHYGMPSSGSNVYMGGASTQMHPKRQEQDPTGSYLEDDPLYRARARSVELLSALHQIKDWLDKLHADILRNAPPHIRNTLDQRQV